MSDEIRYNGQDDCDRGDLRRLQDVFMKRRLERFKAPGKIVPFSLIPCPGAQDAALFQPALVFFERPQPDATPPHCPSAKDSVMAAWTSEPISPARGYSLWSRLTLYLYSARIPGRTFFIQRNIWAKTILTVGLAG